jgi:CHAD domain-containing protein
MARALHTPVQLSGDLSPDTALRRIVAGCRTDLGRYRATVLKSNRPIGIHQTRVALRRLRAAIGLFRSAVDDPALQALSAEAGWLAGECGPARDLHVFLTETAPDAPDVVKRIGGRLKREHTSRARSALSGARFATFDHALAAFIEGAPATPAAPPTGGRLDAFAATALEARHTKVMRRGHKIASLDSEGRHRVRIAGKKLRYAATFLLPAFKRRGFDSQGAAAYIEATARLQNALGALNDRAMAQKVIDDLNVAARPAELVGRPLHALAKRLSAGEKRRERRLERAWKAFRKAEPFWRT